MAQLANCACWGIIEEVLEAVEMGGVPATVAARVALEVMCFVYGETEIGNT